MHKKSVESSQPSPGKTSDLTPPPAKEKPEGKAKEEENEKHVKDTKAPISKEELREYSIAALRAKAQVHCAKMLGTVSDTKTSSHEQAEEPGESRDN